MDSSCAWTAFSQFSWISLVQPQSGSGTATISFTVDPNLSASPRAGSIVVNGSFVLLNQQGYRDPQSQLYLITPCRFIDTRDGAPMLTLDRWTMDVVNRCGIPADTTALVANVTVVNPSTDGFLAVYPSGGPWPGTETVSFRAGRTRANNVLIPVRYDEFIVLNGSRESTNVLIDVTGYFK
jgi:all-beta uncharacterized protein